MFHNENICRHTDTYRLEQENKRLNVFKRFIAVITEVETNRVLMVKTSLSHCHL